MSIQQHRASLVLEDGSVYPGTSFGAGQSTAGEVVFNTGMVGYPETLTDPSYKGQILVATYPLIGNYGIPPRREQTELIHSFEADRIQVQGLIVADYSEHYHHWDAAQSLGEWFAAQGIPALSGIDTRSLTQKLRVKGTMLGKIIYDHADVTFYDPNRDNLVAQVSIEQPRQYGDGGARVVVIDCGCKANIIHSLVSRGVSVLRVPWDYDFLGETFDGLLISNGPGDPKMYDQTAELVRRTIARDIPVFGICLGHQLLARAIGADTYKLKYGHRSQNQPVREVDTHRCLVTSQNHGFAVDHATLPGDWQPWFVNLNDETSEGIRHRSGRFRSVQFHPEANPGPVDAAYLFDEFVAQVKA